MLHPSPWMWRDATLAKVSFRLGHVTWKLYWYNLGSKFSHTVRNVFFSNSYAKFSGA